MRSNNLLFTIIEEDENGDNFAAKFYNHTFSIKKLTMYKKPNHKEDLERNKPTLLTKSYSIRDIKKRLNQKMLAFRSFRNLFGKY
jgi:hypothetical protein